MMSLSLFALSVCLAFLSKTKTATSTSTASRPAFQSLIERIEPPALPAQSSSIFNLRLICLISSHFLHK